MGPTLRCAVLLLALGCGGVTDDKKPSDDTPPPATAHWMADVFADRPDTPVGRILLPGAFNSSSYACAEEHGMSPDSPDAVVALWGDDAGANEEIRQRIVDWSKTQGRSLDQQLLDGIRFLRLNLTVKDGVLVSWHSVYGVPVDEVLDPVVAYANDWPDEVVVVAFGLTVAEADWPLFADALEAPRASGRSFCDLVYDGPEDLALLPLSAVRASGRNLLWSPSGDLRAWLEERGGCAVSQGEIDRVWSITDTPEGVEAALADSVDSRDPGRLLINDFAFSLDGSETDADQIQYILGHDGVQAASVELGFAGDFPSRLIETYDTAGNLNILAGAWYQDTTLVEAAIARNRER